MKLDRNINSDGTGKYALVNLRKLRECARKGDAEREELTNAMNALQRAGVLNYGKEGTEHEFFPIMLKDENAERALLAYADQAAYNGDKEFADEVLTMALRSGPNNQWCKKPD